MVDSTSYSSLLFSFQGLRTFVLEAGMYLENCIGSKSNVKGNETSKHYNFSREPKNRVLF
jgi:hypothetical protein